MRALLVVFQFQCYIATAANRAHAKIFLDAMDDLDAKAEHSRYFNGADTAGAPQRWKRLNTIIAGSKSLAKTTGAFEARVYIRVLTTDRVCAPARAPRVPGPNPDWPPCMLSRVRLGTSTFTSIIVDDCRQAKGVAFKENENTWVKEDRNNIWLIDAFNPLLETVSFFLSPRTVNTLCHACEPSLIRHPTPECSRRRIASTGRRGGGGGRSHGRTARELRRRAAPVQEGILPPDERAPEHDVN